MSAETLRRAAALMRERAEAATPSPWLASHDAPSPHRPSDCYDVEEMGSGLPHVVNLTFPDAAHIASWHPTVALAVADWLKGVAADVDKRDNPERVGGRYEVLRIPDERAALAVARAYLGGAA